MRSRRGGVSPAPAWELRPFVLAHSGAARYRSRTDRITAATRATLPQTHSASVSGDSRRRRRRAIVDLGRRAAFDLAHGSDKHGRPCRCIIGHDHPRQVQPVRRKSATTLGSDADDEFRVPLFMDIILFVRRAGRGRGGCFATGCGARVAGTAFGALTTTASRRLRLAGCFFFGRRHNNFRRCDAVRPGPDQFLRIGAATAASPALFGRQASAGIVLARIANRLLFAGRRQRDRDRDMSGQQRAKHQQTHKSACVKPADDTCPVPHAHYSSASWNADRKHPDALLRSQITVAARRGSTMRDDRSTAHALIAT